MAAAGSIAEFNFFIGYESQNVFVYFLVIPLLWCATLDYKWIRKPVATLTYLLLVAAGILCCGGWAAFTNEFYNAGIGFCAWWKRYGYSYAEACIVWCILWPMVVSILLMLIPRRAKTV